MLQKYYVCITVGNGVTTIGLMAFAGCTSLTKVTIGNSVTTIEGAAFNGCISLTNVTIPKSVTTMDGKSTFLVCNLTTVTIDSKEIVSSLIYTYSNGYTHISDGGGLVANATTIYINEEIEEANIGSYITTKYNKQATSDKTGYVKYVKK